MDDTTRHNWTHQAEKLLLSLRDIIGSSITLGPDGVTVSEISILAEGNRPPKQIVRDVRSALRAEFQIDVDYRKISVAQKRHQGQAGTTPSTPSVLTLPVSRIREEPAVIRLEFGGVTVGIEQHSVQVMVDLVLGDREARGEASGANVRQQIPRLVAQATLDAVGKFLDPGYDMVLADFQTMRFSGEEIVLVGVKFYRERMEKTLTGSCVVAHDLHQSVVYATLDALNRILGRLRYREPVEFELRPTTMS